MLAAFPTQCELGALTDDQMRERKMGRAAKGDLVEIVPIDDTFVTKLGRIDSLGNGLVRAYLCTEERGLSVVRSRLVMPVACAVQMNSEAASILAVEYRRAYPLRVVRYDHSTPSA